METADPWPTRKEAIDAAAAAADHAHRVYGDILEGVWLYGSRARGNHRADSDLDLLLVKKSKESDPRDRLWPVLYNTLMEDPYFGGYDDEGPYYGPLGCWVSIHTGYSEQLREWDTMFYRSVRADAIKVA